MEHKGFSVGEVLKFGWTEWKKHWGLWIGVALFASLIPAIPQIFMINVSEDSWGYLLLSLISFILVMLTHMGILTMAIKASRQEEVQFSDFFSTTHLFPSYFCGKILYLIGSAIGFMLFIIPGIFFVLIFNLWPFFVLDRGNKGLEALKASRLAVVGYKWDLFLFWIAAIILNFFGILLMGIGFLVTWPITLLAWAKIYQITTHSGEQA